MPPALAPAAASPTIPPRFPCTIAANGSATRDAFGDLVAGCRKLGMMVIARTDPHAAHQDVYDAHPDWIAVDAEGKKRRHWAIARVVGHLRAGSVQLRIHDRGHTRDRLAVPGGRHLQQSLGGLRHVLLRALPGEFQGGHRPRPAAHQQPAGPARAAPTSSGGSSACSSCGGCGTGKSARSTPTARYIPNAGGGALSRSRHEDHRRAGADPLRRPPGAQRPHRRPGPTARTARNIAPPWAASPSAASSASAWRSRIAGRTRCRAGRRSGSGWSTASPTACARGSRNSPARCTTALAAGGRRSLRLALSQRALSAQ